MSCYLCVYIIKHDYLCLKCATKLIIIFFCMVHLKMELKMAKNEYYRSRALFFA